MTMRVMITGGAGFIGSRLTRACLREGWEVAVLYQPDAGLQNLADVLDQVTACAVPDNGTEAFSIVGTYQPHLVFHLASVFIATHERRDIRPLIDSNIAFGVQLLEAMARHRVPHFVNTGTSWQHARDNNYEPANLYAATKQAFQDILEYYVMASNLDAITLKLYDTYGPADRRPKLFNLLERAARDGTPLDMSPGEQLIDIVHVDDVVRAFLMAAKRLLDGKTVGHEVYAVSSGQPITLRDLVGKYQKMSGRPLDIRWGGRPYRPREVMVPWTGGASLPGWEPQIDIDEGIRTCLPFADK